MLIYPKNNVETIRYCYNFSDELVEKISWNIFVITVDISSHEELSEIGFKDFITRVQEEIRVEFENICDVKEKPSLK